LSQPFWVLDTNVVIAGLLWSGVPARLLDLAADGDIVLVSSPALIAELARTLGYRKFARRLAHSGKGIEVWVRDYRASIELVEPDVVPRVIPNDPADDHVIACAIVAKADAIVSGDRHLLDLQPAWQGIEILTPRQAVERIG
jgi:putative PIN family toxin of toxin-antitoxin system